MAADQKQRKMDWTREHDILLCREIIVNDLFAYKAGSKERGQSLDKIAEILNAIPDPWFKVDQRSIRDRIKKLLGNFIAKRNAEDKASGIAPEYTELDDLLNDISERKHEGELAVEKQNDNDKNKKDKERAEAEEIRMVAVERLSETRRRSLTPGSVSEDDASPPTKRSRSSGGDTISYLREKAEIERALREKEIETRKEELNIRKAELEISRNREILNHQQTNAFVMLCTRLADKFT